MLLIIVSMASEGVGEGDHGDLDAGDDSDEETDGVSNATQHL